MSNSVIFIGSKRLGLKILKALHNRLQSNLKKAVTFDDSKDVRTALENFQAYVKETGLLLDIIKKPSDLREIVENEKPDLCVVSGWYWIIPKSTLDMVPRGFVGIHGSLLPKYRGNAPLVWALINGETIHGISLFRFDEGIDTGDIIAQRSFEIASTETIADILNKVEELSPKIVSENVPLILTGEKTGVPQNHDEATYCSQRRPKDGRINWNDDCNKIFNFIRAQTHPYPGAFSLLEDGSSLKIWKASQFPYEYYGVPGLIVQKLEDHVVVTCGRGALNVQKVQLEVKAEIVNASEILKYGMLLL